MERSPDGERPGAVFSRSARLYDAVYSWKDYAAESERVREIVRSETHGRASRLLDVACGTGKHIERLRPHFECEGLDADAELLEIARTRNPGVAFHRADMAEFDLPARFDAVTNLFSSIGYAGTVPRLLSTVACMARRLRPGGVLLVEPWFSPEAFTPGHVGALFVDEPELKVARMSVSRVDGALSLLELHYLLATPEGVESFRETHTLALFTRIEYEEAFRAAGLEVRYDPEGLTGRGLYIGRASAPAA